MRALQVFVVCAWLIATVLSLASGVVSTSRASGPFDCRTIIVDVPPHYPGRDDLPSASVGR